MITFSEARALVTRRLGPQHRPSLGRFVAAEYGWEDSTHYRVLAGAEQDVYGTRELEAMRDPIVILVDKDNGDITRLPMVDAIHIVHQMRKVGPWPMALPT